MNLLKRQASALSKYIIAIFVKIKLFKNIDSETENNKNQAELLFQEMLKIQEDIDGELMK